MNVSYPVAGSMVISMISRDVSDRWRSVLAAWMYINANQGVVAGKELDFTSKAAERVASEVVAPPGAPSWAWSAPKVCAAIEVAEANTGRRLARQLILGLPAELDAPEMWAITRQQAQNWAELGIITMLAVHDPRRAGDTTATPHAHCIQSLRALEADGFGTMQTAWNRDHLHAQWREAWRHRCSEAVAKMRAPN